MMAAGGHVTAAERLGQRENVGLQIPMLEGEPFAGATQAGLHFVADKKRAVLAAEGLSAIVVIVPREFDALALDEFDDEGGDVALFQFVFELGDIAHRHGLATGDEWAEAFVKGGIAGDRKRTVAESVVGILQGENAGATRGALGELQRALDGLGAAVAKEYRVEMWSALLSEALDEALGEQTAHQRGIELYHVGQIQLKHIADRLLHDGMIPADIEDAETGKEIEVILAVHVVEIGALRAGIDDIESDGALDLDESPVQVMVVQLVIFAEPGSDQVLEIKRHRLHKRISRLKTSLCNDGDLEAVRKIGVGDVTSQFGLNRGASDEHSRPKLAVTRRAEVLLPSGVVPRSSQSYGYAPHSTPRQKAKPLSA